MAINLASKYSKKVADKFYEESIILGKTSNEYDWDGVKSINVYTIDTQAPGDYTRSGTSRYGTPTEVQDTIQTMAITQDKSVSMVVDKGNNKQEMLIKNAGKVVALELREQFVPMMDKYCVKKWANCDGVQFGIASAATTKANVIEHMRAAVTALRNKYVSVNDCFFYVNSTTYSKVVLASEFIGAEKLVDKAVIKGQVGMLSGIPVIEIPDDYLPANVEFMLIKKNAVLAPTQIKDIKVHEDAPGISGALMEIRWLFDAFVLDTKRAGVYVGAANGGGYEIEYKLNGGDSLGKVPAKALKIKGLDHNITEFKPVRAGYTFKEWNTASAGTGTTYNPGASYSTDAGLELYAIWEAASI